MSQARYAPRDGAEAMAEEKVVVRTEQRRSRHHLATLVTEVFAPVPLAAGLVAVVAFRSAASPAAALGWALLAAIFTSVLPLFYLIRGVRRRQFTDRHVRLREQRPRILLVGVGLVAVGLVLLTRLGAPREIVALLVSMIAGLLIAVLISLRWKASLHTASAAGTVVILALVLGPIWLALFLLVGLVGWARVELGDHTPAQAAVGALVGAAVAGTIFTLVR